MIFVVVKDYCAWNAFYCHLAAFDALINKRSWAAQFLITSKRKDIGLFYSLRNVKGSEVAVTSPMKNTAAVLSPFFNFNMEVSIGPYQYQEEPTDIYKPCGG